MELSFNFVFIVVIFFRLADGTCNYPSSWKDLTWTDSQKDTVFIYSNFIVQWEYLISGTTLNMWDCYEMSGNILVSRSRLTVSISGVDNYAFLCMQYYNVNASVVLYYLLSDVYSGERVTVLTNQNPDICDVCLGAIPDGQDVRVMTTSASGITPSAVSVEVDDLNNQLNTISNPCASSTTISTTQKADSKACSVHLHTFYLSLLLMITHCLLR